MWPGQAWDNRAARGSALERAGAGATQPRAYLGGAREPGSLSGPGSTTATGGQLSASAGCTCFIYKLAIATLNHSAAGASTQDLTVADPGLT